MCCTYIDKPYVVYIDKISYNGLKIIKINRMDTFNTVDS